MSGTDSRNIAGDLVDPDHRLPGERDSETSPLLEDAQHWMQVYQELLAFKRTLLSTAEIHKEGAPPAVVEEVGGDQAVLRLELGRLERRHLFWEQRVQELRPG